MLLAQHRCAAPPLRSALPASHHRLARNRPLRQPQQAQHARPLTAGSVCTRAVSQDASFDLTQWGSYTDDELGGPPSYAMLHAQHKQQLPVEERRELGARLRRAVHPLPPGVQPPCPLLLRVFRYAVDDLRLYQAIHSAGMEGTIVVADDPDEADVVLATPKKRTGKQVPLTEAKRLADTRGLPYVALPKLSAERLMKALSPLMGIPVPPHLLKGGRPPQEPQPLPQPPKDGGQAQALIQLLAGAEGVQTEEGEVHDAGTQQQQQQQQLGRLPAVVEGVSPAHVLAPGSPLGLSSQNSSSSSSDSSRTRSRSRSSAGAGARAGAGASSSSHAFYPRVLSGGVAASFGVRVVGDARDSSGGSAAQARLSERPMQQELEQHLSTNIDNSDVEDNRAHLLPRNPTELLGPRYPLMRPVTPGSRIARKRAAKQLAEERAPW